MICTKRIGAREKSRRSAMWLFLAALICWATLPSAATAQEGAHASSRKSSRTHKGAAAEKSSGLKFEITFPSERSAAPLTGRVILVLATTNEPEPRFQTGYTALTAAQMFGVNVNDWMPGTPVTVDASVFGYPIESLAKVAAGDYYVQAVLNIYQTYHLANGHTVELPPDKGEGQHWARKPGNLYSAVQHVHVDPTADGVIHVGLSEVVPPVTAPQDTDWIKHVRIESALLTKFYGTPTYITGDVLLPPGWNEHPNAHYPLMVYQGHFAPDWRAAMPFRTEPPSPDATGRERMAQEYAYKFYQDWTSGRLPHFLVLTIQHANPYFDDSYAVNSENVGPYGDAIVKELIPEVERRYRGIGQGWARAVYGGSTGGWETLASQVFYPDFYNGAWTACPDPVDFRAYQTVNLYEDKNAFWVEGPFAKVPRGMMRTTDDEIENTMEGETHRELVLGTKSRSGDQFDIWQAVFSPAGDDGYPREIWDPMTGEVNHDVAEYWKQHYDLSYIIRTNWSTLGPKLVGKLHFTVGTMDTFYLNNAVSLLQDFLEQTNYPYYAGDFEYGEKQPHCYTGGPINPPGVSGMTWNQRIFPQAAEWMKKTAPKGADMSWVY